MRSEGFHARSEAPVNLDGEGDARDAKCHAPVPAPTSRSLSSNNMHTDGRANRARRRSSVVVGESQAAALAFKLSKTHRAQTLGEASRLRRQIFFLLEMPGSSKSAFILFLFLFTAILTSVGVFFISTLSDDIADSDTTFIVEMLCTIVFTCELCLRTALGTLDPVQLILKDPFWWFDVLSVLPFYAEELSGERGCERSPSGCEGNIGSGLIFLRLFRLMRVIKLLRHYSGWRVLIMAIENSWRAILVPVFAMMVRSRCRSYRHAPTLPGPSASASKTAPSLHCALHCTADNSRALGAAVFHGD